MTAITAVSIPKSIVSGFQGQHDSHRRENHTRTAVTRSLPLRHDGGGLPPALLGLSCLHSPHFSPQSDDPGVVWVGGGQKVKTPEGPSAVEVDK